MIESKSQNDDNLLSDLLKFTAQGQEKYRVGCNDLKVWAIWPRIVRNPRRRNTRRT